MASLDEIINKVPKPILVICVLTISLILIFKSKPLKNGCEIQISNFSQDVSGYLIKSPRNKNKKMVLPQVEETKSFCKTGNSPGACQNYFSALKKVEDAFIRLDDKCLVQLVENEVFVRSDTSEESIIKFQLKEAVKILSLLAWGEKPPAGLQERAGWLSRSEIFTFCRLKTVLLKIIDDEEYQTFKNSILREYPDVWPEKLHDQINSAEIQRPTALKWKGNPTGQMDEKEVIKRSLLSIRCDQFQ